MSLAESTISSPAPAAQRHGQAGQRPRLTGLGQGAAGTGGTGTRRGRPRGAPRAAAGKVRGKGNPGESGGCRLCPRCCGAAQPRGGDERPGRAEPPLSAGLRLTSGRLRSGGGRERPGPGGRRAGRAARTCEQRRAVIYLRFSFCPCGVPLCGSALRLRKGLRAPATGQGQIPAAPRGEHHSQQLEGLSFPQASPPSRSPGQVPCTQKVLSISSAVKFGVP